MGWQPGEQSGTGEEPEPGAGLPGRLPPECSGPGLSGFAKGGAWNSCPPSADLAAAVEVASGREWRCEGASRDELVGLLRQWQALESWAAAGKLGLLRALVREEDQPLPGGGYHGDLPTGWTRSLTHEVALALAMPAGSAEQLMWLAWDLRARLPGTGALLAAGQLTYAKAKAVDSAFQLLSDEDVAAAEALILPVLPGKTYGQVQRLADAAALAVDPGSATKRREEAERNRCRVQLSREDSGAVALSGRDLPTDQALAAHASVCDRARQYKESGVFPGGTRMDQYRAAAYLDLLNGIPAEARIAAGEIVTVFPGNGAGPEETEHGDGEHGRPSDPGPDGGPGGGAPRGGSPVAPGGGGTGSGLSPRLTDLVLPLATLLGLAERPGEGHGLGPLDPSLCRELAIAATGSPWTRLCVTVTDPDGIAVGHGCAKPPRSSKPKAAPAGGPTADGPTAGVPAGPALAARVNLTITDGRLAELAATGPPEAGAGPRSPDRGAWSLTRADGPGPPGGYGAWTLTLPGGRQLAVRLEPVPTLACDHRHETGAYQPGDTLRHLVQVRDYECTFPPCSRHARESDFEHGVPYHRGGRTCACNAGARSRACHRVKQSKGWTVAQPRPGWHQWETPAGRTYTQGPKRYPN